MDIKKASQKRRYKEMVQRWKDAGLCLRCGGDREGSTTRMCESCKEENRVRTLQYREEKKRLVLEAYGGKCSCCGEEETDFLTVDHVNGDGAEERKQKLYGTTLNNKIIKEGYPDRYRILCFNCNFSAHQHGGTCVHRL